MTETIEILASAPPVEAFIEFREKCGWGRISGSVAEASLASGLLQFSAWQNGELAGFVRVVGDGVLYFYVQDLVVRDDLRGRGIGKMLMERLMAELRKVVPPGGAIGLMSATGKEVFYESFGFVRRPNAAFGAGMTFVASN